MNLKVYTVKERKPEDGEIIFALKKGYCFDFIDMDVQFAKVEYQWMGEGENEGGSIIYDGGETPEGFKLEAFCIGNHGNHFELEDDLLYIKQDDLFEMYKNHYNLEEV